MFYFKSILLVIYSFSKITGRVIAKIFLRCILFFQSVGLRQPMSFESISPAVCLSNNVNGPLGYTQAQVATTSLQSHGMQPQINMNVPGRGMINPQQTEGGIPVVS